MIQKKTPPQKKSFGGGFSVLCIMDPLHDAQGHAYPLEKDTTHLILKEISASASVFITSPQQLFLKNGTVMAETHEVKIIAEPPYFILKRQLTAPCDDFSLVLMRKDPPVDESYISTTHLLSQLSIPVLNAPHALRDWNEKLSILEFPRWIPSTLVTSRLNDIRDFLKARGNAVLKSLTSYGGRGVHLIDFENVEWMQKCESASKGFTVPVMVQELLNIHEGEKRVFFIDGETCGAILRIPAPGAFLANPDLGASVQKTSLTKTEKKLCSDVGRFLKREKIWFAGLDLIGEKLTEINITSPGMLWEWNRVDRKNHAKELADSILRKHRKK